MVLSFPLPNGSLASRFPTVLFVPDKVEYIGTDKVEYSY